MLFKKIEYNSLKTKVDNTDTTKFVLRTKYEKMDQILKMTSARHT